MSKKSNGTESEWKTLQNDLELVSLIFHFFIVLLLNSL